VKVTTLQRSRAKSSMILVGTTLSALCLILVISGLGASSNYRGEQRLAPKGVAILNNDLLTDPHYDSTSTHDRAPVDTLFLTNN